MKNVGENIKLEIVFLVYYFIYVLFGYKIKSSSFFFLFIIELFEFLFVKFCEM